MYISFGPYYRANVSDTLFPTGGSVYSWNHKIARISQVISSVAHTKNIGYITRA